MADRGAGSAPQAVGRQLRFMGLTFIVAAAAAALIASQRPAFEQRIGESYSPLPARWAAIRDGLRSGGFAPESLRAQPRAAKLALYEQWMLEPEPDPAMARRLAEAHPGLYVGRAERTLVCGSDSQKTRAVEFILAAGGPWGLSALRRARAWHAGDGRIRRRIEDAVARLEEGGGPSAAFPRSGRRGGQTHQPVHEPVEDHDGRRQDDHGRPPHGGVSPIGPVDPE